MIWLEYEKQKKDRYGRKLANLYLADGTNIGAWMLKNGYAKVLTIPPNNKNKACYEKLENFARSNKNGLWKKFAQ